MKQYITLDPWKIIEDSFNPEHHQITESLMSIGNGRMGQRANNPETYGGETLKGNYIAGVYYPDKTRVGWWKNGYPEYFAKVLNSLDWIKKDVFIDDQLIDMSNANIKSYRRWLDMKEGILYRDVTLQLNNGNTVKISTERFYSIADQDKCFLRYTIKAIDRAIKVTLKDYLDFNVRNSDANYDEDFWEDRKQGFQDEYGYISATTKKTKFLVAGSFDSRLTIDDTVIASTQDQTKGLVFKGFTFRLEPDQSAEHIKSVAICSSFYYDKSEVSREALRQTYDSDTYSTHKEKHIAAWANRWQSCDIKIEGDVSAQQGIRFNIFQLYQTYSGEDSRLNIGPKGFTGEKYGGSTYWDTEAYCLPFYMATSSQEVAKNLLIYRHNHLAKAIENASLLGFERGAALYPMVTINGEECHNEWEITFEEIHRNGAIAYAIYSYIRYTGDKDYLISHGLDVLIGISRFWAQRVHLSPSKGLYVMMGVTGPNEYENNVDNNWYTNYIARWCLQYTRHCIDDLRKDAPDQWISLKSNHTLEESELNHWEEISAKLYLPEIKETGLFIQHDGFLNKEDLTVNDLKAKDRPINQNWSWDRILRSPFIKQADVLQGLYFFEDHFSKKQIKTNFDFYEPKTVHESSLSPCVHSILASSLGLKDKAYEMYLRTARLDLDNYNNDTEDGCHITSMAGTWMSIVEGFAGMRVKDDVLSFSPTIINSWDSYSFKVNFRGRLLELKIDKSKCSVINHSEQSIEVSIMGNLKLIQHNKPVSFPLVD